ncbi:MAG: Rieske 2Fe-2S domain-containing protein, partial [Kangiellaceae bacterium]|nr:Rieske 2Fe-2S domain-containing protein [Kangiellaceae bacterium]
MVDSSNKMLRSRMFSLTSRLVRGAITPTHTAEAVTNSLPAGRYAGLAALGLAYVSYNSWKPSNSYAREFMACRLEELEEGVPREFDLDGAAGGKVVLVKVRSKVYALSGTCPSNGGSVAGGFLAGTTIYCPLNLASFDVTNGELLGGSACDSLKSYPVRIVNGDVIVNVAEEDFETPCRGRVPVMSKPDGSDPRTFVVIGAGPGG